MLQGCLFNTPLHGDRGNATGLAVCSGVSHIQEGGAEGVLEL